MSTLSIGKYTNKMQMYTCKFLGQQQLNDI